MRILHLSTLYPPYIVGGAERSVAMLAEAQVRAGHTVAAACIAPREAAPAERNGVRVYRMPHENDFWMEDWPKHSQAERERAKFKQQFNLAIERRFDAVLEDFRPDLVNTHSLVDISTRTWRAADRRGVPIVHTLRDYDLVCAASSMFRESGPCRGRHLKCRALTFTKGLDQRRVRAVSAVGGEVLKRHLAMGFFRHVPPQLRRVIWNTAEIEGVDDGYRRAPIQNGPFTFGYLGRISPEKGVATLLKACRGLPPHGWRLLIGGAAQGAVTGLAALAEGLPVKFLGFVKPVSFFEQVDVLVAPSLWAEPLGRTVIEAYRVGVPVIGSDTGGIAELIADPDWLTPAGNAEALAARMASVLAAGRAALPPPGRFARVLQATRGEVVAASFLELYEATLSASDPMRSAAILSSPVSRAGAVSAQ
jgi:glycosyltransferase involved in cell wall biosynthesis